MEKLWQQMADLTMAKCRQKCKKMGMCCSPEYCEMAQEYAKERGIELKPVPRIETTYGLTSTGKRIGRPRSAKTLLFLDNDGKCIVPPHLRPLCTLHQCDINGFGFCPEDSEWTQQYFDLREKLEEAMFVESEGVNLVADALLETRDEM